MVDHARIDLVPDLDEPEELSPLQILREQAQLIEQKAQQEIRAVVESARSGSTRLAYDLVLVVPLVGYRHKLLRIEFGIEGWPVDVSTPENPTPARANDEASYGERLRQIFGAPGFRRVISHMRTLYREESELTPAEEAVLGIFAELKVEAGGCLPIGKLESSLRKLPGHLAENADAAMDGLDRKGLVMSAAGADGYVLTNKGASLACKKGASGQPTCSLRAPPSPTVLDAIGIRTS